MEPIVIIVLLLGAFALGAESADTQPVKTPEPVSEQQPKELSGRAVQSTVQTCLSNRQPIIYRDLTIPVTPQEIPLSVPPRRAESGRTDE